MNITVVDPGQGPGKPAPPLFLDQTEAWRAEKKFFLDHSSPLFQGLDDRPPPPLYLKVWICHCAIAPNTPSRLIKNISCSVR